MTDDPTTRPDGVAGDPEQTPEGRPVTSPDPAETRLRKALAMTDHLEPPRDDLFAQRALVRGRARTARRRNGVLGAAAAVALVATVGGSWALSGGRDAVSSAGSAASAESAAQTPAQERATGTDAGAGALAPGTPPSADSTGSPQMPPARDGSEFFGALSTPATRAFDAISTTVTTRWADVFSGAYPDDPGGARVVVALTRPEPALRAFVTGALPAGSVRFVDATHTWADKLQVASRVREDTPVLRGLGVDVQDVGVDARADRVVVAADEGASPGTLEQRYGPVVSVVAPAPAPPKLPNGSVLPTPQR